MKGSGGPQCSANSWHTVIRENTWIRPRSWHEAERLHSTWDRLTWAMAGNECVFGYVLPADNGRNNSDSIAAATNSLHHMNQSVAGCWGLLCFHAGSLSACCWVNRMLAALFYYYCHHHSSREQQLSAFQLICSITRCVFMTLTLVPHHLPHLHLYFGS